MKTSLFLIVVFTFTLVCFDALCQQMPSFLLNSVQKVRQAAVDNATSNDAGTKDQVKADTDSDVFTSDSVIFDAGTYTTVNLIDWGHFLRIAKFIQEDIELNKSTLRSNAIYDDFQAQQQLKKHIAMLEDSASRTEVMADSAYFKYVREFIAYRSLVFGFGTVRSKAFFDLIYGGKGKTLNALSSAGLGFGKNTASIFSELVSGNLGLVRASIGTMITGNNNDDEKEATAEEAYQKLATYGGNTVLLIEYPILYWHSSKSVNSFLMLRSLTRGAADIPVFGTTSDEWAGNLSTGLDLYVDTRSDNGAIGFFANMNFNGLVGTDTFRQNLDIGKKWIWMSQLSAGIIISDKLKISFNILTLSNSKSLRNKNVIAGGQVMK